MVHDRKASEDIVQDVFLALWERREEVDFDRPLLPLLFVAVKNRAIDLLRSKKWRGGNPDWTSWMSVFVRLYNRQNQMRRNSEPDATFRWSS